VHRVRGEERRLERRRRLTAPLEPIKAVTVPGSKHPVTPLRRSNSSPPFSVTVYQMSLKVKVIGSKGISIALAPPAPPAAGVGSFEVTE
jgi:hypothetical protein